MMSIYTTVDGPVGELLLVGEGSAAARGGVALVSVSFADAPAVEVSPRWRCDAAAFAEVERQLREYFAGDRRVLELDHVPRGTAFQQRVWAVLEAIPYGATTSYGRVAEQVGAPRDRIRAIGAAIGANPLLIVRPCHRVVGADGSLTGYAGGVPRKHELLTREGALQPQLI
jgi:methylated-DNA-[protein]-cysteine S-methyltransferase